MDQPGLAPESVGEEADDDGEQGGTLDESGSHDHVRTEITADFRLAGHGFEGGSANAADADTGADGSDACAESGETLIHGFQKDHCEFHEVWIWVGCVVLVVCFLRRVTEVERGQRSVKT